MSASQFTIYRSTDSSAPTLSGTAGDLVNLLDKVLADGYGSKSAAGWTKAFTGTNKRVYRAPSGSRLYFRVDDTGAVGAGGAQEGLIVGYESMSDVDTGTGPFPTAAQMTNGAAIRKSSTANATTHAWIAFADARTIYLFVQTGDSAGVYKGSGFGEIYSLVSNDAYNGIVIGQAENTATNQFEALVAMTANCTAHYMCRGYSGLGGSVPIGKHGDGTKGSQTVFAGTVQGPDSDDGSYYAAQVWVHDKTTGSVKSLRGWLRGVRQPCHAVSVFTDGDSWAGIVELTGKTFLAVKSVSTASSVVVVETSNTVDTN